MKENFLISIFHDLNEISEHDLETEQKTLSYYPAACS